MKNNRKKTRQKNSTKRQLIKLITYLIVSLIVGTAFFTLQSKLLMKETFPMPMGIGLATIETGSMEPAYSAGDLIVVSREDEYKQGDTIVYKDVDGMLISHRIILVKGNTVTTKGDANNTPDPSFDMSRIKGRIIFAVPYAGFAVDILRKPAGTVTLLLIIIAAAVTGDKRQKKEEKEKEKALEEELTELQKKEEEGL